MAKKSNFYARLTPFRVYENKLMMKATR